MDSGMRGNRTRNKTGRLRQKRADTKLGTPEEQYGTDLERRSDLRLGTLRKEKGEVGIKKVILGQEGPASQAG